MGTAVGSAAAAIGKIGRARPPGGGAVARSRPRARGAAAPRELTPPREARGGASRAPAARARRAALGVPAGTTRRRRGRKGRADDGREGRNVRGARAAPGRGGAGKEGGRRGVSGARTSEGAFLPPFFLFLGAMAEVGRGEEARRRSSVDARAKSGARGERRAADSSSVSGGAVTRVGSGGSRIVGTKSNEKPVSSFCRRYKKGAT